MADAFILTDIHGELAWRQGHRFLPVDGLGGDCRQVTLFSTKRAAQDEVKRLRKRGYRLRVQRIELPPAPRTVVIDPYTTVTTFAYSPPDRICSVLRGSAEEKDLANGRPKQKRRRKAIAHKAGAGG